MPRLTASELSPSTFARKKREGKLPWTKLFADSVQTLMSHKISDRARSLWLLAQPILGEHGGYLLDLHSQPHTPHSLSLVLHGRDANQIDNDLQKLIQYGALSQENGTIFCPIMVKDKGAYIDVAVGVTPSVAKCNDHLVTTVREKAENLSDTVEYSREVNSGAPTGHPLFTDCNSGPAATETNQKSLGARGAQSFCGLTGTDLDAVSAKYPDRDADATFQKFVRYHTNKGTAEEKITRGLLDGWFKREKPKKEKAPSTTVTTTAGNVNASALNRIASETAFMRDMPRVYQLTAEQRANEAQGWYYEVPGLDEATRWFYNHQNIDRDDPAFEDEFDRVLKLAVKNSDVILVDSAQGECQVGANRQPVMIQKEAPQYNKGKGKDKVVVCMLEEIFIDDRKITRSELDKIRAMDAKTENQAIAFLKELLPDVETNWTAVLDEDWLFEKDANGLHAGKVTA